jgi:hypothetical protein
MPPEPIHLLRLRSDPVPVCGTTARALEASTTARHVTCVACQQWLTHGAPQPESALLEALRRLGVATGHTLFYHTHDSRHSPAGFPDVMLARPEPGVGLVDAFEAKTPQGNVSLAQQTWLAALDGKTVHARVVRPADLADVPALVARRSR